MTVGSVTMPTGAVDSPPCPRRDTSWCSAPTKKRLRTGGPRASVGLQEYLRRLVAQDRGLLSLPVPLPDAGPREEEALLEGLSPWVAFLVADAELSDH